MPTRHPPNSPAPERNAALATAYARAYLIRRQRNAPPPTVPPIAWLIWAACFALAVAHGLTF